MRSETSTPSSTKPLRVIQAKAKDLGDNFLVRRSLPNIDQRMVGPFIFWDHMGPAELSKGQEMTVHAHPHIGLSTITYLFSGQILHRDSLGNELWIRPGEVNWMTSGSGIAHSERAFDENEDMTLEGIQLWVAMPKEKEEMDADFAHYKEDNLPMVYQEGFEMRLIAGAFGEKESPLNVHSPLFYLAGEGKEAAHFSHTLKANEEGALYLLEGKIEIEGTIYEKQSLLTYEAGSTISWKNLGDIRFMFFGGEVFPEPRHIWWNFVSHSKERIEQAKKDWNEGRFKQVIHETKAATLPGEKNPPSYCL